MSKFTKTLAVLALVAGVAFAPQAKAATMEELQALIASLQAQLAALSGGSSSSACYTHSMTLKVGSTGSQVMAMQSVIGATADGKFGPMTKAKVQAFQASKGLTADGVVGAMTGAALAASCSTTPTTPTTPGTVSGGAGDITVDKKSTYSSEEVGEGENNSKVLAFDIEADEESDVKITSMKVELHQGTAADEEDLNDYVESVSVWMGSDKVGEVDMDEFSESSDVFTKSINLTNAIVDADSEETFTIAVNALSNLDSGDIDSAVVNVGVSSIRFVDGQGVVTTDGFTLDVKDDTVDDTLEESFTFGTFADAADVELNVSLTDGEEEINDAHIINVESGSSDTDNVKVLAFTLEAEGDSDIMVSEIPVLFTTTGETDEAAVLISATLWMDGEELDSADVPTGGAVTFEDLEVEISQGDTADFVVSVDLQDLTGALDEGDTVKAELTGTEVDAIEAEDESGEDLAAADLTGTAAGEAHAVYDVGFNLELVGSPTAFKTFESETSGTGDRGTFVIKYKVTAFDGDIYIDNTCVEDNDGSEVSTATSYSVSNNGSNTTSCTVTSTGDTNGGNAFLIEEGTSETITLTVQVTATADSSAFVSLEAIGWDDAAGGDDNVFDFALPEDFKTDPVFLDLF